MSKLFYDHLLDLNDLEALIKKNVKDQDARQEIYRLIDEIVHHRVIGCILQRLPSEHHKDFINHVASRAHDEGILEFVRERVSEDVEEFIKQEVYMVGREILDMFGEELKVSHTPKKATA